MIHPVAYGRPSAQPRILLGRDPLAGHVDEKTASAIEIWAHENMQGVSSELLGTEDAGVTEMMLMCNPVRDRGPATWHRDHHPIDTAPLLGYIDDIVETGPRYVQWNLSLYDDSVLWVLPGQPSTCEHRSGKRTVVGRPKSAVAGCCSNTS